MCGDILLFIFLILNSGVPVSKEKIVISLTNQRYTISIYDQSVDVTPSYVRSISSLDLNQQLSGNDRLNKITVGVDEVRLGNTICDQAAYSEKAHKLDKCLVGLNLGLVKELTVDNVAGEVSCKH